MRAREVNLTQPMIDTLSVDGQLHVNLNVPVVVRFDPRSIDVESVVLNKDGESILLSDWLSNSLERFSENLGDLESGALAVAGQAEYYASLSQEEISVLKSEHWVETLKTKWWCRIVLYGCKEVPL